MLSCKIPPFLCCGARVADQIPEQFQLSMYDFDLPEDRIAQVPADRRDRSRLMRLPLDGGEPTDHMFADVGSFLRPGDCLVLNDTKVFPARLFATKPAGGRVELLALELESNGFTAMYGTHRGLRPGTTLQVLDRHDQPSGVPVLVESTSEGKARILMGDDRSSGDTGSLFARFGHMPLPPYIKRPDDSHDDLDLDRYQTVYAANDGAVAAPTAGLHFTPRVLDGLRASGVETVYLTLHVGPGTFRPIRTDDVRKHDVGTESYVVPPSAADAINRALDEGRRVIAVGTTVVRTLEAAAENGRVKPGSDATSILITPGYQFKIIDGMLTNFHIPKSSLILLVSALVGRERILDAYRTAVARGYRFYSYGDSMLIL